MKYLLILLLFSACSTINKSAKKGVLKLEKNTLAYRRHTPVRGKYLIDTSFKSGDSLYINITRDSLKINVFKF